MRMREGIKASYSNKCFIFWPKDSSVLSLKDGWMDCFTDSLVLWFVDWSLSNCDNIMALNTAIKNDNSPNSSYCTGIISKCDEFLIY